MCRTRFWSRVSTRCSVQIEILESFLVWRKQSILRQKSFHAIVREERGASLVSGKRAAVGILLDYIATFLKIGKGCKVRTKISATSGRFLLTESGCKARTAHNDMQCQTGNSSGNFLMKKRTAGRESLCMPRISSLLSGGKKEKCSEMSSSKRAVHSTSFFSVWLKPVRATRGRWEPRPSKSLLSSPLHPWRYRDIRCD